MLPYLIKEIDWSSYKISDFMTYMPTDDHRIFFATT